MSENTDENKDKWLALRKDFPDSSIGLLPKVICGSCAQATKAARSALDKHCDRHQMSKCKDCGNYITNGHIHLNYVGHAAITDRLNSAVGPENWELIPLAFDDTGNPKTDQQGQMWFKLTILGASKICVGDGSASAKELIGDALRNGCMRFGVATKLWSKEELESSLELEPPKVPDAKVDPPHKDDPAIHVEDSEPIPGKVITQLEGQVKLKGITDPKQITNVLNNLAHTKNAPSIQDVTVAQGREIYALIRATEKIALELLTETDNG